MKTFQVVFQPILICSPTRRFILLTSTIRYMGIVPEGKTAQNWEGDGAAVSEELCFPHDYNSLCGMTDAERDCYSSGSRFMKSVPIFTRIPLICPMGQSYGEQIGKTGVSNWKLSYNLQIYVLLA